MPSATAILKDLCDSIGEFSEILASQVTTEDEKTIAHLGREAALPRALDLYIPGRRTFENRRAALLSGSVPLIRKVQDEVERPIRLSSEDWDVLLTRVLPKDLEDLLAGNILSPDSLAHPLFRAIADGVSGFRPIYLSPTFTEKSRDAMLSTDADLFQDPDIAAFQAGYLKRVVGHDPARAGNAAMSSLSRGDFRRAVMLHLAGAPLETDGRTPPRAALQRLFLAEKSSNHGILAFRSAIPSLARHLAEPRLLESYLATLLNRIPETS